MKKRPSQLQGLHLHFDPTSGIAGDMTVAALVDLGVPRKVVAAAIDAMGVKGLVTRFERRKRGAFVGTGFVVSWPGKKPRAPKSAAGPGHADHHHHGPGHADHHHHHGPGHADHHHHHDDDHGHVHRDYAEIRRLLAKARLDAETRRLAAKVFERIAVVEAARHGVAVDKVGFHEVGAYDSIADIVGAAAALAWLRPVSVTASPPVLGTGIVRTQHGPVPVPAPATAALLEGVPVLAEGAGELTTPTGAALLVATVDRFAPPPPMRLLATGYGAGTRELGDRANVLRVLAGEVLGKALPPSAPEVLLLDANIDDMSPQLVAPLMDALFSAGALDVWATPIMMKKGRPALQISVMAAPDQLQALEHVMFSHSSTLGMRIVPARRSVLQRSMSAVKTPFGQVAVKLAVRDDGGVTASPEFDDCDRLARKAGVPTRDVLAAAQAAALALHTPARRGGRR